MDIETNPNLTPVASKSYRLPLKHLEWVRIELENLERKKQELSMSTKFTCARDKNMLYQL